jgi:hypothetical protein
MTYCPDTGWFTYNYNYRGYGVGQRAGRYHKSGYRVISVDGVVYSEHRLAVLYMTGSHPTHRVDHKNTVEDDNRWDNLRLATAGQNAANSKTRVNTSGHKGVYRNGQGWGAGLRIDGKIKWAGTFPTLELAIEARKKLEEQYHGEFAFSGERLG